MVCLAHALLHLAQRFVLGDEQVEDLVFVPVPIEARAFFVEGHVCDLMSERDSRGGGTGGT